MDNKKFVKECLRALVQHGKTAALDNLTSSAFCSENFGIEWKKDGAEFCTVLKFYDPNAELDAQTKDASGQQRYYLEPMTLFGTRYLVYNNWLDSEHSPIRRKFFAWVKNIIFPELSELESILETK